MQPNPKFSNMPKSFWATVRTISQQIGYTVRLRGISQAKIPTIEEINQAFIALSLEPSAVIKDDKPTQLTTDLIEYYKYRADVLNNFVEPRLMDAVLLKDKQGNPLNQENPQPERAKEVFLELRQRLNPTCPLPMNKQKGEKKAEAYFTGIINMLIEENKGDAVCNYDPRELTTITLNDSPLRTLARRVDGAFPQAINPVAIWEIKEYYYTTTFGSRVADGVYETLLDGMELEELHEHENIKVHHYLMIDSHYTWWVCGKSYLCRIIDMLNMGYVDEVLFGYEVVERLPTLVKEWTAIEEAKGKPGIQEHVEF